MPPRLACVRILHGKGDRLIEANQSRRVLKWPWTEPRWSCCHTSIVVEQTWTRARFDGRLW